MLFTLAQAAYTGAMMKKLHSPIGVDEGEVTLFEDFASEGPMWTGEGAREIRHDLRFSESFAAPPSVRVGLVMWDISSSANARVDLAAEEIGRAGFQIRFRTWGDSRIARVRVAWQAIGPLPDEDRWEVD